MKFLNYPFYLIVIGFLAACTANDAAQGGTSESHLMDETFAPASYRSLMDSARGTGELSETDHGLLLQFILDNATSIPAERSLGSLLTGAQGLDQMNADPVRFEIEKVTMTTDRKIYGFHFRLVAHNQCETSIRRVRAYMEWLDLDGKHLKNSPVFSIAKGDIAPGESQGRAFLETAYYRPTGNELNDRRQKAWRDTLKTMEKTAGNLKPERFKFHILDYELSNGLSPSRYWLKSAEERAALKEEMADRPKLKSLDRWAAKNGDWLGKLKAGLGEHYLEITPILTDKGELTHGEYLLDDRVLKVKRFFTVRKKVPGRRVNPTGMHGKLVMMEEIDFWKWPMELRIYESDID